jgi:zinc transport system substrate-binding protein
MKKVRIKRITVLLFACVLSVLSVVSLFSCGASDSDGEKVKIVCTAFPQYDWLRAIIGDCEGFSLSLLVDNGSDLHSYQPTVADRVEIAESDILVTVGGESDAWAEEMADGKTRIIPLFEVPNITLCEVSEEGIVSEHIHTESHGDHENEHDHEHDHDHGAYDEHIWLSLSNARVCVEYFKAVLAEASPNEAQTLEKRADEYITGINALEKEYMDLSDGAEQKRLIFADRFPFAYLTADFGIEYCAAFSGCSTENNADLSTVTRLSERVREWNARYILVTETSDGRLANGVIAAARAEGIEVLTMDSMQALTRARMNAGDDYLSIMRANLGVLRKALS